MRRFLIPLLMAGAFMPAAAMAQDGDGPESRAERRAERAERRAESNNSAPAAESRPQRVERVERPQRIERVERPQIIERVADEPRLERRVRRVERVQDVEQVGQIQPTPPVQDVRVRRQDGILGAIRETAGNQGTLEGRPATRDGVRDGRYDRNHRWSNHWRTDHRYDWRRHRDRHRSIFRLGRYYDPYGWGYRRFSIGFSIGSSYYGSNYWLDDPWMYRLPPVYGPYRWVRYYDDALLVNLYSGQVVDVIHNFFW